VLSDFSSIERATIVPEMIDRGEAAITAIVRDGVAAAMNAWNTKT
jgi:hypothetical protein